MSLSDDRVVTLLKSKFVPAYVENEQYRGSGGASPEDRKELQRIHQEGYAKKLSVGTVHAFVLDPDGHLMDSLHVVQAAKTPQLLTMLQSTSDKVSAQPGPPLLKPLAQPQPEPGSLQLHLVARYLHKQGNEYVINESRTGDWGAMPSIEWLGLKREEWTKLLPTGTPHPGQSWNLDPTVTATLLTHFYPPTENNDLKKNHLDEQSLKATVTAVDKDGAHVRLEGRYKMQHTFYYKPDGRWVEGALIGTMDLDRSGKKIKSLELVTDEAVYRAQGGGGQPFGVAVRSTVSAL